MPVRGRGQSQKTYHRSSKLVAKESLSWEFTQGKSNKKQPLNGVVPKALTKLRYFNQRVIDRVAASVHNRVLFEAALGILRWLIGMVFAGS